MKQLSQVEKARQNFANHVQSVAFQISLSRAMIAELHVIRDFGYPRPIQNNREFDEKLVEKHREWSAVYPREMRHFMTHRPALERRGLVALAFYLLFVWTLVSWASETPCGIPFGCY